MTSAERIFSLMDARKVSAYKLSKDVGIAQGNISDWKSKKANPSYGALVKIAKYFNVTVEYLECKTDDPAPTAASSDDVQIEILARAARKMTPEEKQKLIDIAKVMFEKAFDEDKS